MSNSTATYIIYPEAFIAHCEDLEFSCGSVSSYYEDAFQIDVDYELAHLQA